MRTIARLLSFAAVAALAINTAAQEELTQAKGLYESASDTEALAALNQIENPADVVEVETYRALRFLALGRSKEAEQSLETLALSRPFHTFDDSDASPRLVRLYQDVRRRTLPEASKQIYQRARASFDNGDMTDAARHFKDVVALADSVPQEHAALMAELKMLAAGFVRLTETTTKQLRPFSGTAATALMATPATPAATNASIPTTPPTARAASASVDRKVAVPAIPDVIYATRTRASGCPLR